MEDLQNLNWSGKRPPLPPALQLQQFDKDFNEEKDLLFCMLNEIEPTFVHEDNSDCSVDNNLYIDPRTNIIVTEGEIDHSNSQLNITLFSKFFSKSLLSKNDQASCSIYFILKKTNQHIPDKIKKDFNRTAFQRQKDQENFLSFLKKYCETQFQNIYNPGRFLYEYTTMLCTKVNEKLLHNANINYQILTAFPMPNNFSEAQLTLNNIEVISKMGQVPLYRELNLNVLKPKFQTYFNNFLQESINRKTNTSAILKISEKHSIDIYLPDESLLFLLSVPEETDTNTHMHFEIHEEDDRKYVIFEKPMPSKNASLETNTHVFAKTYESFLSMSHLLTWFQIYPDALEEIKTTIEETRATNFRGSYKMHTFEDYMEKYVPTRVDTQTKFNEFMVKATLGEGEGLLNILTSCKTSFCKDKGNMSFINSSIKLEYKKQFGCEILTIYELLKEWINQKFIPNSVTDRHRIDIQSFMTIEHQIVTLEDIENEIEKNHKIDFTKVLASLHHFLSLTKTLPSQKYLLRHSSNQPGKLMVYKECYEETAVSHHSIATEESGKLVTFKAPFIPIDETVYTEMHQKNRIIPCSFPPWLSKFKSKVFNDRDVIIENVQKKNDQFKLHQKLKKSNSKQRKRAKKKSQRKKTECEKMLDEINMKNEIENDKKLFGYSSSEEKMN